MFNYMLSNPRDYNELLQYLTLFLLIVMGMMVYYISHDTERMNSEISKLEYDLKDELIRATIMDTQDDVEEIKETIKKIDERLYEMTR